jgi:hypothetical protein
VYTTRFDDNGLSWIDEDFGPDGQFGEGDEVMQVVMGREHFQLLVSATKFSGERQVPSGLSHLVRSSNAPAGRKQFQYITNTGRVVFDSSKLSFERGDSNTASTNADTNANANSDNLAKAAATEQHEQQLSKVMVAHLGLFISVRDFFCLDGSDLVGDDI